MSQHEGTTLWVRRTDIMSTKTELQGARIIAAEILRGIELSGDQIAELLDLYKTAKTETKLREFLNEFKIKLQRQQEQQRHQKQQGHQEILQKNRTIIQGKLSESRSASQSATIRERIEEHKKTPEFHNTEKEIIVLEFLEETIEKEEEGKKKLSPAEVEVKSETDLFRTDRIVELKLIKDYVALESENGTPNLQLVNERFRNQEGFIVFYSPGCPWCHKLVPAYTQLGNLVNEDTVKLGAVNSLDEEHGNHLLADFFNIGGYPTIKYYKNGEYTDYTGGREVKDFLNFLCKTKGLCNFKL